MQRDKLTVVIDADIAELIPGYLANRRADIGRLEAAVAAQDTAALQSIGHKLKGTGGGYGFEQLSVLGAAIEEAGKAGDMPAAALLIKQLDAYLDKVDVVYE